MNKIRSTKGITLIALVATIIILLILTGVTIAILVGDNGLINRAKDAKIATEIASIKEEIQTDILGKKAENKGNISDDTLKGILEKYGTINYEEDGNAIKSITTTKGNHEIAMVDIWNKTILANESDTQNGKLHIGDFINYSAGTWTDSDMTTIANTGIAPNNSTNLPTTSFQFGGFEVGYSRDNSVAPYDSRYTYVQDKATNSPVSGWRLFDMSDGVMTLLSAGCPEAFYVPNYGTHASMDQYILTGSVSPGVSKPARCSGRLTFLEAGMCM